MSIRLLNRTTCHVPSIRQISNMPIFSYYDFIYYIYDCILELPKKIYIYNNIQWEFSFDHSFVYIIFIFNFITEKIIINLIYHFHNFFFSILSLTEKIMNVSSFTSFFSFLYYLFKKHIFILIYIVTSVISLSLSLSMFFINLWKNIIFIESKFNFF